MIQKVIAILIPVAVMILFILIMNSASYLKMPFSEQDDLPAIIHGNRYDLKQDNWAEAESGTEQLEKAWQIITDRVQFSAERDELRYGRISLARLRGFIEAKDKAGSLAELNEIKEHWTDIGE